MELSHVRAFLAVAEELHFGRAAERLHIAQPPLSRLIQQLERDLGTQLFERTTRSVRLTPAGEALIAPATEILDGFRVAKAAVNAAGKGEIGRVRVGFAGPSSHMLIGKLARLVREKHPGIELGLRSVTYAAEGLSQVMDGVLDLAMVRWRVAPPGIASRVILNEHYVLVVPEDHRLACRKMVSMAELRDEQFVALPADPASSLRDSFIRKCHEAGFAPDIVQVAPDSWTVMALVAAGVGVTYSYDSVVVHIPREGIAVIPLEEGVAAVHARLAWRSGGVSPALLRVLEVSEVALPTPAGD